MSPCAHQKCIEHYLGGDWKQLMAVCKECNQPVQIPANAHPTPLSNYRRPTKDWPYKLSISEFTKPCLWVKPRASMNDDFVWFESGNGAFTQRRGLRGFSPDPPKPTADIPRGMSMTPQPSAQFGGNMGFNPSGRSDPYRPPQRRTQPSSGPIVRPESSISNATFGSQASYLPAYNTYQPPSRGLWTRGGQDSNMSNLGAGLSNLRLDSKYQSSPDTGGSASGSANANADMMARRDSKMSSNGSSDRTSMPPSRQNTVAPVSSVTARYLAGIIKSGATEDPYDRTLSRYDTPPKLETPALGPARFNERKVASSSPRQPMPNTMNASSTPATRKLEPRAVPEWLKPAMRNEYRPNLNEATESMPFSELFRGVSPPTTGLMRINDIPYATTRPEIIAFVGRNAQIARLPEGSPYHAVHIIMERESGKTMDCFVEFATQAEADWVCRQFIKRVDQGRPPKVGDRPVEVSQASHDEFLSLLFPRAKHMQWSNGQPIVDTTVRQYYPGQNAQGFKGFIHPEEFNQLKKHAGLSDRSPFASRSPCRVYEHMITTLYKFPWYAVDYITMTDRRGLYECTAALLRILMESLRRPSKTFSSLEPTTALLQELVVAALSCPGFSEKQKYVIVQKLYEHDFRSIAEGAHTNMKLGGHFQLSGCWPFLALSPVPGTDPDLLKFYAALLRKAAPTQSSGFEQDPLGKISPDYGPNMGDLTLAQVADIEWAEVDRLLKRVCAKPPSPVTPSASSDTAYGNYTTRAMGTTGSSSSGSRSNGTPKSLQYW